MAISSIERDILVSLRKNGESNTKDLCADIKVTDDRMATVNQALRRLVEQGWLTCDTKRRPFAYRLKGAFENTPFDLLEAR